MIRPSARSLVVAALLMWLCSLGLVGFATGAADNTWLGYEILGSGWLGFFANSCAWYANPFFLWAAFAMFKGRRAGLSAGGALLLAADTLLTTQIPIGESGRTDPVYGFGWGAVVWGLALAIMVAAAGTRALELRPSNPKPDRTVLLRPIGLIVGIALVVLAVGANVRQRQIANQDEQTILRQLAYQRAPVCGAPDPVVAQPLQSLNGPLEMRVRSDQPLGSLSGPSSLLAWGVPIVRFENRDYALLPSVERPVHTSRPAAGPAAAVLDVVQQTRDGITSIHVSLTDLQTQRRVFDQTWNQFAPQAPICPAFSSAPNAQEQPRKLVAAALHLAPSDADTPAADRASFDQYWAMMGKPLQSQVVSRASGDRGRQQSTNCPATVGWVDSSTPQSDLFRIDQAYYEAEDRFQYRLRCETDRLYFYRAWTDSNPGTVQIEARSLTDFHLLWAGKLTLELVGPDTQPNQIQMRSASASDSGVKLDLVDPTTGRSVLVNLPEVR